MGHDALRDERAVLVKAEKVYDLLDDLADDTVEMGMIAQTVGTLMQMKAYREQQERKDTPNLQIP